MYLFELQDILFAVRSLMMPTKQFSITIYISFNSANTRYATSNKFTYPQHLNNQSRHSYFHRLPGLWNAIPILNLNLSNPSLNLSNPSLNLTFGTISLQNLMIITIAHFIIYVLLLLVTIPNHLQSTSITYNPVYYSWLATITISL